MRGALARLSANDSQASAIGAVWYSIQSRFANYIIAPFVYVTRAEAPAMKAAVRALGLEVGMRGAIGFDRGKQAFFIDETATSPGAREALQRVLGRYMTVEAQASWKQQIELGEAVRETPDQTNEPRALPAASVSPFRIPAQPPSVVSTAVPASTSGPSSSQAKPVGTAVDGVRRLGSDELMVIKALDERPNPDHPMIKAWSGILPDRVTERRSAAAAIIGDALANYGLKGVDAKIRQNIESDAREHKQQTRREMFRAQLLKTLGQ